MAVNPLRLKPTEVLRLLNSTPIGTVAGERLLRRHRDAAGMNISDDAGQTVFHIHWHIIPRFENDGLAMWAQGSYPSQEEMNALAEKIAGAVK